MTPPELFEKHFALALFLAHRKRREVPPSVYCEELENAALEGLWLASRGFDESHGAQFSTYAGPRIEGAMLDYLRSLDRYRRHTPEEAKGTHLSLDWKGSDSHWTLISADRSPVEEILLREEVEILYACIAELEDRDREIVSRCFLLEEFQSSVAEELGLTNGRISQVASRVRARLGKLLTKRGVGTPVSGRGAH